MAMNPSKLFHMLTVSLGLSLLVQPQSAVAGTILFNDTSDTVTATVSSDISSRPGYSLSCSAEGCTVNVPDPTTSTSILTTPGALLEPGTVTFIPPFGFPFGVVSDSVTETPGPNGPSSFTVTFSSDTEIRGLGLGIAITEDGSVQPGGSIVWNADHTDTFSIQSDLDPPTGVQEPFTLSLFGAGLLGAAAMRRWKSRKAA
jgi:hypothetical protein